MTTPSRPITPGSTGTPGDSVRPVNTGQEVQLEKTNQCLDQSEFSVLNSPGRSVQLEHNVHEQPGDVPNLQIEHLSEHFQVDQDLAISDSPDIGSDESTERLRTHLQDSGFRSSGTGHTVNPLGTGHTGNRSDREHSVRRSRSVRSDAMEHGSVRTRHRSDVSRSSRRDSHSIPLRHTDPGELSPASMIRHRRSRNRSSSYDSVSPRRRSRSSSRSRGKKKKSHKKRKHSTSRSSSRCSSSDSSRERKPHKSKEKKKKHSKSHSSKRDKCGKKHKRRRSPTPSPSSSSSLVSSDSSSSPRRSPARKKSRMTSRSPSPAVTSPHSISRTENTVSHRDILSLCASNDDEFNNSPSEDDRDLAPDPELTNVSDPHSEIASEDIQFRMLIEEVLKLLPADMFPRKTDEFPGGNRPRSSIDLELQKVAKKSISLPQSRRPLMRAIDCLEESLGASRVDDSVPMPPTISQDWVPSQVDIKKLVPLRCYQAYNEFLPTTSASALDPDAARLGMSLTGSYPVKLTAIKDLETQSRLIIRLLSHAETFSFAAFKSLQSESMDSKVLLEILKSMSGAVTDAMSIATAQTLGLQQLRREATIDSAPRCSLTTETKRKLRLSSFSSKLLFDGQVGAIYKDNMAENQETLITNAVSYQSKPNPSSPSSKKPKAKFGKKKAKPQETPKKDFTFTTPRPPKKGQPFRGSSSRGRGGGPSRRGASTPKKH